MYDKNFLYKFYKFAQILKKRKNTSTNKDGIEIKTIGEYMPDKFRFTQNYRIQ